MMHRLLGKIALALRYFLPSRDERAYLREIARAQAFDRAYYLQAHPGLHPLFRLMPERHYVQHGEDKGLSPNGRFSPRAYLFHNPDLDPATTRPLLHYLQTGRGEDRTVMLEAHSAALPVFPPSPAPLPRCAAVAVVLHLYYLEMWEEFAPLLKAQTFEFDLWVTLTQDTDGTRAQALRDRIVAQFAGAQVYILPNHGRDLYPFVWVLEGGALAPYAALCKLHSKKSPHRADGDDWRQALTQGILGDPAQTARRLDRFLHDPTAGFWVAEGQHYQGDVHWGVNRARACALLARGGLSLPDAPLSFPAGSIYWMRQEVAAQIRALGLGAADFEPEQALVDGTTAHALERLFGSLADLSGRRILTPGQLDGTGTNRPEGRGDPDAA